MYFWLNEILAFCYIYACDDNYINQTFAFIFRIIFISESFIYSRYLALYSYIKKKKKKETNKIYFLQIKYISRLKFSKFYKTDVKRWFFVFFLISLCLIQSFLFFQVFFFIAIIFKKCNFRGLILSLSYRDS